MPKGAGISQGPGRFGTIPFPLTASSILALFVIVAAWIYSTHPPWRPAMDFLGVGFAMAATVLSAYYIGLGLRITIEQRTEALRSDSIARAFVYVDGWDQQAMSQTRQTVRDLVESVRINKNNPQKITEELAVDKVKATAVWDVLNFFEGLSLASNRQVADDETLRRCFGDMVVTTYLTFEIFIKEKRAETSRPQLYAELEKVVKCWST